MPINKSNIKGLVKEIITEFNQSKDHDHVKAYSEGERAGHKYENTHEKHNPYHDEPLKGAWEAGFHDSVENDADLDEGYNNLDVHRWKPTLIGGKKSYKCNKCGTVINANAPFICKCNSKTNEIESVMTEKNWIQNAVHPSKKGMFKDTSLEQLRKDLSAAKAKSEEHKKKGEKVPHELRTKLSQLVFAIRGKKGKLTENIDMNSDHEKREVEIGNKIIHLLQGNKGRADDYRAQIKQAVDLATELVQMHNTTSGNLAEVKEAPLDKITNGEKTKLGLAFKKYGLDGNGRFDKVSQALSATTKALDECGFTLDMVSGDLIMGDKNSRMFPFRRKNAEHDDAFSEKPEIRNSRIVFTWENLSGEGQTKRFEVLVYAS